MFIFLILHVCFAALPACRWAADDPVCYADCIAICQPTKCTFQCENNVPPRQCFEPVCKTDCLSAEESDVMNEAPKCETKCQPLVCLTNETDNCAPLCEAPVCAWLCDKPNNCPIPRFELNCEKPSVEYSAASETSVCLWISVFCLGIKSIFH